jgi:hypothetical protein
MQHAVQQQLLHICHHRWVTLLHEGYDHALQQAPTYVQGGW